MMSDCKLNLTKIQSLPVIKTPGKYAFFVDITFDSIDNYQKAIKIIELMAQEFKILGEYKDQKIMKVGIIGLGLIGGSIALKLKDLFDNLTIYGYDIDHDSISYSIKSKIIDAKYDEDLLNELDFVFLAIPVESIKNQLQNTWIRFQKNFDN